MNIIKTDLCVIGAGSGGLSVAAGAVQMGASVVLIEVGKMGGDCLNYGCVPSKATISVARTANTIRHADTFAIVNQPKPVVDYHKLAEYVQQVIAKIAPNDSVERFTKLGVQVIQATGGFIDPKTVRAGDNLIKARRFVVATGSSPAIPPIPGLENCTYYTNETIFNLTEQPKHLLVIGGGPIGCELAQAYLLMGTPVSLLEAATILPKDDPEAVNVIRDKLISNGLNLQENIKIIDIKQNAQGICIVTEKAGQTMTFTGSHLLLAAGRLANLATLNLAAANIAHTTRAITVDSRLRTSNKKVFAIGDVIGSYQFTHAANYHAGIVIRNALFHLPAKVNYRAMPWVTYTNPELAQVGPTPAMLAAQNIEHQTIIWPFAENDRAIASQQTTGFIKVQLDKKGKILAATIVGANAGELLTPWILAINKSLKIKDMAEIVIPYPTLSEVSKRVAGRYFLPLITSNKMKRLVKFLQKF
jgi:pyruvate/2-oxoglutarate dehydrogenase complex dihydrolipoamide dehydrogenase (E3) component